MFLTDTHFDTKTLTAEALAEGVSSLPSAPLVLPCIYRWLRSGNATLQQVSSLVRLDPGLTARVHELGNRYFVSHEMQETNLAHTINLVGFDAVDALVSHVADAQVFVRPVNFYGLDADEMWRLSISCALASELLAERTGQDAEAAYFAGLFHGCGMIAVDDYVMSKEPALMLAPRPFPREFTDAERSLLGFTHADVGAAMLRKWGFPEDVCDAVKFQYAPFASAGYARQAALLYAAKWLRSVVCADADGQVPVLPPAFILDVLRMRADTLAKMVIEVRVKLGYVRNQVNEEAA